MNKKYLTENTTSDVENLFNGLKRFVDSFKNLTPEQITQLKNDPYGVGLGFFNKIDEALEKISKIDSYSGNSLDYINSNKEAMVKSVNEFKNIVQTNFPDIYNQNFKFQFDSILGSSAFVSAQGDQPSDVPQTPSDTTQAPSDTAAMEKPKYDTSYTGPSIVDFLKQSGQPSDFESRRKLAVDLGIVSTPEEYEGLSQQNIRMLDMLRGTTPTMDGVETRKAELAKPYTKPKGGQGPTIRYAGREYPAYIDMGGGKYRLAYQEELDNPNMQLYIPNPKKGQQEYGKPNFVKVRREGGGIRRQSQFGGALGSASNLLGDIGNTLAGKR
jgi:hypothetical protein